MAITAPTRTRLSRDVLLRSWQSWFSNDVRPVGPGWLQLLWTLLFCMAVAVPFTVFGFAAFAQGEGAWRSVTGWLYWYGINLQVSLVIGFICHFLFWWTGRLIGAERMRRLAAWQRTLYFTGVPIVGVLIGWPLGVELSGYRLISWRRLADGNTLAASILVSIVMTLVFHFIFAAKSRQLEAEKRAAEAQLRLLQGQIEPHFLFNTLANVISLIDHEPAKARQMLESFTDYLRSSLGSLRAGQATLGQELALAQSYLLLLKSRMEDRLQFSIEHDPALRDALLPPLLLQPLVENAIHHGLEPQVDGGTLCVRTRLEGRTLVLEVADNGRGLQAPSKRKGAGVALANLRERLLTQYGDEAGLTLADRHPGTLATVRLPFETQAPSKSQSQAQPQPQPQPPSPSQATTRP